MKSLAGKLYSPLFIRVCASQHNLTISYSRIKRRRADRQSHTQVKKKMATVASSLRNEPTPTLWKENLSARLMCPECKENPPNLRSPDSHETICGSCGLVLADREIDPHSEWRTFSNDDQNNDDPSRVGDAANPLLNGNQLETSISFGTGGARSRELHRAQSKMSSEKTNKALLAAYKEIGSLCDGFNIQKNVADTAKYLFKVVDDAKAFKGKSQDVIIAGCIFIACRQCKVPRTFTEIFAVTRVSKKEIGRIYKALEKFFTAQNLERINSVVSSGGKSFSGLSCLDTILTVCASLLKEFLTPTMHTLPPPLPNQVTCATVFAICSICHFRSPTCHPCLLIGLLRWVTWQVAHLCPSLLPPSIWPRF